MDLARQLAIRIPIIIAAITLLIAAIGKGGREKGAIMLITAALGMCVMSIAMPIIYSLITPRLITDLEINDIQTAYMVLGVLFNILWAVPVLLIAIATFQRPPAAAQHRPYSAYPPPLEL